MIQIRPVSDLRNKYPEIENIVANGNPVYLTKNGYGTMVVLSLEAYESLTENLEMHLDRADKAAEENILGFFFIKKTGYGKLVAKVQFFMGTEYKILISFFL